MMNSQSQSAVPHDRFESGAQYEPYVGRWSRLVAQEFIHWLDIPPGSRWLDVGCGTGALSQTILERTTPSQVTGVDRSEGFIDFARNRVHDPRASFKTGDAQALPADDASYDAVVSGLMLNFVPDHKKAVSEMRRTARPGGVVGVYVWDYAEQMQMMRVFWDAVVAMHPAKEHLDESRRFPICRPEPLKSLFSGEGWAEAEVRAIDIPTRFRDFDDYWAPFLGGQGSAPSYLMTLSDSDRARLRDAVRSRLPVQADGSISLIARAWAVKARRS